MLHLLLVSCLVLAAPASGAGLDDDLLAAARRGDLEQVKQLIEKGANIEAATRYATTPLYFAARNGHLPVVEYLLAKGANPNVTDTFYKMHILAAAAEKSGAPVLKALLDAGAKPPPNLLMMAALQGSPEVLRFLVEATKPAPEALSNLLQMALQNNKEANAQVLREAGAKAPELKPVALPAAILARYAGSYSSAAAGPFTFTVQDGKLTGGPAGQTLVFEALDERTFYPSAMPAARLVFPPGSGPAPGFTLANMGQTLEFKRTETQP
jgi:ankyrin repeat protein